MSRGLGYNNRLILAAMLDLDEHYSSTHPPRDFLEGWHEHGSGCWWKVYRIASNASAMAEGRPVERYAADVESWAAAWAGRPRKVRMYRPKFGAYINVGRVLRILDRRGLVERNIYGPGSVARLTAAGKAEAARWLT